MATINPSLERMAQSAASKSTLYLFFGVILCGFAVVTVLIAGHDQGITRAAALQFPFSVLLLSIGMNFKQRAETFRLESRIAALESQLADGRDKDPERT